MSQSARQGRARRRSPAWLRRVHRWLGLWAALFVLLLSVTGIALNHGSDWGLDRRHVSSSWVAAMLGVRAPEPTASFVSDGHRVTQLGRRLYLDATEVAWESDPVITGLVALEALTVVAMADGVLVLTNEGEVVERIDLGATLPGPVMAIGRANGLPVIKSGGALYLADADVTAFRPWPDGSETAVSWSSASPPPASELAVLEELYRGRAVTVERLLLEIHSGRILGAAGPLLLDLLAILLVALSVSGIFVWLLSGRSNGREGPSRR
jgi:hypothetical protein